MKDQKFGPLPVLLLTLAGGIVGFFLRLRMLAVGYDAQGVQIPGSWPFVAPLDSLRGRGAWPGFDMPWYGKPRRAGGEF